MSNVSKVTLSVELRSLLRKENFPTQNLQEIDKQITQRGAAQMLAYLQVAEARMRCHATVEDAAVAHDKRIHEILALLHRPQ
jgi:hypothetical protein